MANNKLHDDALAYHSQGRPGKIEVVPTKPIVRNAISHSPTLPAWQNLAWRSKKIRRQPMITHRKVI
jgi:hypothetical protein